MEGIILISQLNEMFRRELGVDKCVSLKVLGTILMINFFKSKLILTFCNFFELFNSWV